MVLAAAGDTSTMAHRVRLGLGFVDIMWTCCQLQIVAMSPAAVNSDSNNLEDAGAPPLRLTRCSVHVQTCSYPSNLVALGQTVWTQVWVPKILGCWASPLMTGAWLTREKRIYPTCYRTKFGRSRSNRIGVDKESPKMRWGCGRPFRNMLQLVTIPKGQHKYIPN